MLRWGILGPGRIADRALAPAMRAAGHDLACVGSSSLTRAQRFGARHGARRARGAYEEVLEAPDVDAVYVSLPNDLHEAWAIAALEAGKHVLCEKPLALDAAGAQRMAAVAARTGRVLMEGIMSRFHPRTDALLAMVRAREIGSVLRVDACFDGAAPSVDDYRWTRSRGGGAILDLGVYAISAIRWLIGEEPHDIRGLMIADREGVDEVASAVIDLSAGGLGTARVSFGGARTQHISVVGTKGSLDVPHAFTVGVDREAVLLRDGEPCGSWQADPYERMVTGFAEAVRGDAAVLPPTDALATALILDRWRATASAPAAR
ncbi:Gfo/Idh/MocA family oxidoreductase [Egibacter rhizosphaerae]|uniref:Gfo/Idh/MocA family oxidoreductase n=1 Tax=Egibacter rhizosphaerae TaxID=1670831 RepID=A0A411YCU9_9ACTN|nr:Gfo/Idh/MocA family oxidoreductase [Egibacter rhizosphaerae]QBI19016.1 Gfo/Idh/MocA family oxidoreductase [Egibacter rhizosphaerae]